MCIRDRNRLEGEAVYGDNRSVVSGATNYTTSTQAQAISRFQITLIPIENSSNLDDGILRTLWLLRLDTEEELDIWVESLRIVSPDSFRKGNSL